MWQRRSVPIWPHWLFHWSHQHRCRMSGNGCKDLFVHTLFALSQSLLLWCPQRCPLSLIIYTGCAHGHSQEFRSPWCILADSSHNWPGGAQMAPCTQSDDLPCSLPWLFFVCHILLLKKCILMEMSGLQTFCWSAHTEQSVWKWFPKHRWKISILINANFCVLGELSCCRCDSIPFGHAEANSDEYSNFAKENS